jgi:hypothetical protein
MCESVWVCAWVCTCVRAWVCVLLGRGLCVGLITRPEESYRVWCVCEWVSVRECVWVCVRECVRAWVCVLWVCVSEWVCVCVIVSVCVVCHSECVCKCDQGTSQWRPKTPRSCTAMRKKTEFLSAVYEQHKLCTNTPCSMQCAVCWHCTPFLVPLPYKYQQLSRYHYSSISCAK